MQNNHAVSSGRCGSSTRAPGAEGNIAGGLSGGSLFLVMKENMSNNWSPEISVTPAAAGECNQCPDCGSATGTS